MGERATIAQNKEWSSALAGRVQQEWTSIDILRSHVVSVESASVGTGSRGQHEWTRWVRVHKHKHVAIENVRTLICLFYIAVSISNVLDIDTALETRVTKYVSTTKINMYRIMIYFCKLRLEN